jgi:hypothetical protein
MEAALPQNGQGNNAAPDSSCPTIGLLFSSIIIMLLIKKGYERYYLFPLSHTKYHLYI